MTIFLPSDLYIYFNKNLHLEQGDKLATYNLVFNKVLFPPIDVHRYVHFPSVSPHKKSRAKQKDRNLDLFVKIVYYIFRFR